SARWRECDQRRAVTRERSARAGDRAEPPVLRAEPGDAAAPRVDHVHEVVAGGDADGLQAAGGDAIGPLQAVLRDLEDRDVVAPRVDGVEPAAIVAYDDGTLRAEGTAASARRERARPRERAGRGTVVRDDRIGRGV